MTTDKGPRSLLSEATIEALRQGDLAVVEALREAVASRRRERGGHAEWARLCEEAGETALALSEYQLALRDDAADAAALARLSVLYQERGELDRAIECADRWSSLAPADEEAARTLVDLLLGSELFQRAREAVAARESAGLRAEVAEDIRARIAAVARLEGGEEPEEVEAPGVPSDADAVRFAHLFAGRENVYARQWAAPGGDGGYSPVHEPFTVHVARNHLLGSVTVGIYPVRLDNTVTFFAFDVDINKRALVRARGSVAEARRLKDLVSREARRLQDELAALGVPALLEDSGYKGRHLWVFLTEPEDGGVVRTFGALFLGAFPVSGRDLHVEFFPKQASTGGGVGNLIKLPLGIHRRTGRRSRLLRPDGSAEPDPHGALRRQPRLGRAALHGAIQALKARAIAPAREEPPETDEESGAAPAEAAAREVQAFPTPAPSWTIADFQTNPEVGRILAHCPVLDALREKVERHRRLTHEEQVVLMHSLGHSGAGVLAVNYLLEACVDVPPTVRLQTPLSGNPISCPKIRKRIPHVTGSLPCNCLFDFAPGHYPTPRLHLLRPERGDSPAAPAKALPDWDPVDRTRALRALRLRAREIEAEIVRLEGELIDYMQREAVAEIRTKTGILRLAQEEGAVPALAWEPEPAGNAGDGGHPSPGGAG
jgi:hypothetical protein